VQIERITLAVTDMSKMVVFYNNVFDAGMLQVGNSPFYRGTFAGISLLFCPNDIAEVDAQQNRHQFRIAGDIDVIRERVVASGGEIINDGEEAGRKILGVRDPDGNTYEIIEA
jgi:predicted enzyme related to lactoylglutathione lyase